jgi:hypothetical protein
VDKLLSSEHKLLGTSCVLLQFLTLGHSSVEITADMFLTFLVVLALVGFVPLLIFLTSWSFVILLSIYFLFAEAHDDHDS